VTGTNIKQTSSIPLGHMHWEVLYDNGVKSE